MTYKRLITLVAILLLSACGQTAVEPTATEAPPPTEARTAEEAPTPTDEPTPEPLTENITAGCVENYQEGVDYFPEKTTVDYAEAYTIEYHDNYKLVTVLTPWFGSEEPVEYVLVQCGTPEPEGYDDEQIIEVPVERTVAMSTSYLPALDTIGELDSLVGMDSFDFVNNLQVREMVESDELAAIGFGAEVNVEQALELEPDLILTYGSGSPEIDSHPVLTEAGLPVVLVAEFMDTNPLGRAEWGKFIALFYNQEAEITPVFAETAAEYERLRELAASVEERPTVFASSPYEGTWYMPGGESFAAQFYEDAGADYLWSDNDEVGSLFLDFETVFEQAQDADFWMNANGFWLDLRDVTAADERFAEFEAFQEGTVYENNARLNENFGNDYFESGVANPDVILADLIAIFHPDLLPDHELVYYQQLLPAED